MTISPTSSVTSADPTAAQPARATAVGSGAGAREPAAWTLRGVAPAAAGVSGGPPAADSFRKFEAMVLRQFIQTMLPDRAETVFGKGMAGDMWKGLMAEKLADAVAARGGIGIADRLLAGHYGPGAAPRPVADAGTGRTGPGAPEQASTGNAPAARAD